MKKLFVAISGLVISTVSFGEVRHRIYILNEVSYDHVQNHPRKNEIITSIYKHPKGFTSSRFFIPETKKFDENSTIIIVSFPKPREIRLNGEAYFADFDNDDFKLGDRGILKYVGDTTYFIKKD